MKFLFQDWQVNKGNSKARIILVSFRLASYIYTWPSYIRWLGVPYIVLYRILIEWVLGVELPWKLKLGKNTIIYHGQGLVVNDSVSIGSSCILRHNVTIGVAKTDSAYGGDTPVIGDNVDIGAGAIILGKITIGNHACIAAGSIVINDVPAYGIVAGNPARLIRINYPATN